MTRPLVTLAIIAYNHERFIRETIRGALAQTYSPLQIIVSDDCSQDGTFEAAREEVDRYDGPHRVFLNRNSRNLGYMGNLNRVMELAEGELILQNDGDDVSLPTRAEEFVRAWSEGDVYGLYSDYIQVDETGVEEEGAIGEARWASQEPPKSWQEMVRSGRTGILGSSLAWDRAVFDVFGPLPDKVMIEDVVIPFRSALLGRIAHIEKPLVHYRLHGANSSLLIFHKSRGENLAQFMKREEAMAQIFANHSESWLRDMAVLSTSDPKAKVRFSRAMNVVAAWLGFYRFKESATNLGAGDRLYRFLHIVKSVRVLGVGPVLKTCLLAASPTAYYRIQRFNKGRPRFSVDPSGEVDPLRIIGPE